MNAADKLLVDVSPGVAAAVRRAKAKKRTKTATFTVPLSERVKSLVQPSENTDEGLMHDKQIVGDPV